MLHFKEKKMQTVRSKIVYDMDKCEELQNNSKMIKEETINFYLQNLSVDDEETKRKSYMFFSKFPMNVNDQVFEKILSSYNEELIIPFLNCIGYAIKENSSQYFCNALVQKGFCTEFIRLIDMNNSCIVKEILKLLRVIIKTSNNVGLLLIENGIFQSLIDIKYYLFESNENSYYTNRSNIIDEYLKFISSFFFIQEFPDLNLLNELANFLPKLIEEKRSDINYSYELQCLIKFYKYIFKYKVSIIDDINIIGYLLSKVDKNDDILNKIILKALIAISSNDDSYSIALIQNNFFDLFNQINFKSTQISLYMCTILQNFSFCNDIIPIKFILESVAFDFLKSNIIDSCYYIRSASIIALANAISYEEIESDVYINENNNIFEIMLSFLSDNINSNCRGSILCMIKRYVEIGEEKAKKFHTENEYVKILLDNNIDEILDAIISLDEEDAKLCKVVKGIIEISSNFEELIGTDYY